MPLHQLPKSGILYEQWSSQMTSICPLYDLSKFISLHPTSILTLVDLIPNPGIPHEQ